MVGISKLTSPRMSCLSVTKPPVWRAFATTADHLRFVSSWSFQWLLMSTKAWQRYSALEKIHTEDKNMKTLLALFVEDNKDRDDIVGDLCYDLYHDDLFHAKKTETEQMAYINRLPSLHGDHLVDAVKEFKLLFKEHSREL